MTQEQLREAAAMYKWDNHELYTPSEREALLTGFVDGATSEAAREYWDGQKQFGEYQRCPICDGSGLIFTTGSTSATTQPCPTCNGNRIIQKPIITT